MTSWWYKDHQLPVVLGEVGVGVGGLWDDALQSKSACCALWGGGGCLWDDALQSKSAIQEHLSGPAKTASHLHAYLEVRVVQLVV